MAGPSLVRRSEPAAANDDQVSLAQVVTPETQGVFTYALDKGLNGGADFPNARRCEHFGSVAVCFRQLAKELAVLQPDLIVAITVPVIRTLQRETQTILIVFVVVSDPIGA